MQLISHKSTNLTIAQKLFIEKSLESLYLGSIDSYRVRLNNPKTILIELKYCLQEFQAKRIKHFHTIKSKDKKTIIDEALVLLKYPVNFLEFNLLSKVYILRLLKDTDEFNYKKTISALDLLLNDNENYLTAVIEGLQELITQSDGNFEDLEKIDIAINILFSELINRGYSKGFLYRLIYGIFVGSSTSDSFDEHFKSFTTRVLAKPNEWSVIFRIDTTKKVYEAISEIKDPALEISDFVSHRKLSGKLENELERFNAKGKATKFIKCTTTATDYLAALKRARSILSEYLDVINLGLSDEFLRIHHRALVEDINLPENAKFQNNVNILDGKYTVEKNHYLGFTKKLPTILSNENVQSETKEKLKSAIRYLRLGNQSTEVEHKFLNYWIGLEYLFSNYESHSTIDRIKVHFINAHSLAYVKRNLYSLKKAFNKISESLKAKITSYTDDFSCLSAEEFYKEIGENLRSEYPILSYRALKLHRWFFSSAKAPNACDYLKKHKENLEIHFTRIYRLRNEIIHDAATDTNNEQIASNLRYYLTFILNEIIDFLSKNSKKEISVEDYFILNEIQIGDIAQNGYLLRNLLDVDCSLDFIS